MGMKISKSQLVLLNVRYGKTMKTALPILILPLVLYQKPLERAAERLDFV